MKPYPRSERIQAAIQTALSELLQKKVQDPRIELATISGVRLTSDLRIAYVYFSVFGNQERVEEVMEGFKSSKGFIKKMIAPKLGLRYMPDLKFVHDKSFDQGSKIDALLQSVSGDGKTDKDL
ncbi:MAG: 30S ribosome-binding factor RbfA [Pseudomonadota bacterium]